MIFSSPYFWRTTHTGRHKGAVFDKMTELCALKPPVSQKLMIVMLTVMCDDNDHRLSEHQQPSKIFKENLFNCDLSQSIDCRQKRPESVKSITSNASLCILANIVCDNSVDVSKAKLLKSKGSGPLISETDLEEGQRTKERLLCLR